MDMVGLSVKFLMEPTINWKLHHMAEWINGFNTIISRIPADKKNLVVILNNTGGTVLNEMTTSIQNILYDKPYMTQSHWQLPLLEDISNDGLVIGLEN
jgi:hypothetical protein